MTSATYEKKTTALLIVDPARVNDSETGVHEI